MQNSLLDVVLDRFGTDAQVINKEKGRFLLRAGVYISDGLVDWLLPYSDRLYVMRPRSLREQVEEKSSPCPLRRRKRAFCKNQTPIKPFKWNEYSTHSRTGRPVHCSIAQR